MMVIINRLEFTMHAQDNLFDRSSPSLEIIQDAENVPGLIQARHCWTATEQQVLLDEVDARPWLEDLKRRVQHYGYKYDYRARRVDHTMYIDELPDFAVGVAQRLLDNHLIERMPDQMIVNEYVPGQGISAHVDCEPCFSDGIVTVSLGSTYEMDFIHVQTKTVRPIMLETGSAVIMTGESRYDWQHQIRARKSDRGIPRGRRVSLTFRNVILDGTSS